MATIKKAPATGRKRAVSTMIPVLVVTLGLSGCGLFGGPGLEVQHHLPKLPRGASLVAEGDTLSFHGTLITFEGLEEREDGERPNVVLYKMHKGNRSHEGTAQLGDFVLEGDYLLQFRRPDARRSTDGTRQLIAASVWHLPSVHGGQTQIGSTHQISLAEGDINFFPGGFVSLRGVDAGDYRRFDDDAASLTLYHNGQLDSRSLQEFQWSDWNGLTVEMRDVFPGELPGNGHTTLRLHPTEQALDPDAERVELVIAPGSSTTLGDIRLRADTVLGGDGEETGSIVLIAEEDDRVADMELATGEGLLFSDYLFRSRGMGDGGQITLEAIRLEQPSYAARSHVRVAPVTQREAPAAEAPARRDPTTMRRTLRRGETLEFWDATFQLDRVDRTDRTRLFDDTVEVTVTYDNGIFDTRLVREGNRDTITGSRRWWIMELQEVRPSTARPGEGEAVFEFSTGVYLGQEDRRVSPTGGMTHH